MVDLIFSALAELIAEGFNLAIELIAPLIGFSFERFNEAFPFAATAYSLIQHIALGIVMLLATAQILPFFFGSKNIKTTPVRAGMYAVLSVFFIYYGNYIFEAIITIAQDPYNAMTHTSAEGTENVFVGMLSSVVNLETVLTSTFHGPSIVLYIIVFLLIGIAFLKLLIECVERYVILFVLVYLSPLASSAMASETTSGVFKRYCSMFVSQCILMILNIWSLKMVCSMFDNLSTSSEQLLMLLMGYAFLRIAAKMDSYLGQLGLSAAVTGAGLGNELMASGMAMASMFGVGTRKLMTGVGGTADGAGKILGSMQDGVSSMNDFVRKYDPVSGLSATAGNAIGGILKTGKQGIAEASLAAEGTDGNFVTKAKSWIHSFGENTKSNFSADQSDAWKKSQGESYWAQKIGSAAGTVNDMATQLTDGEDLYPHQLLSLTTNPWMCQKLSDRCDAEGVSLSDPETVATMAAGIVGEKHMTPEMQEAYKAGVGHIEADDLDYYKDSTGIYQSWSYNGQDHRLVLMNQQQYGQLRPQSQKAFTQIHGSNGAKLYVASTATRTLSDFQKSSKEAKNSISDYFATGGSTPLSPAAMEGLRTNPAQWNAYQQGLRDSGMTVDGSTPEGAKAISSAIDGIKAPNIEIRNAQQNAVQQLNNGTHDYASNDGNEIKVGWHDEKGDAYALSFVTPAAAAEMSEADKAYGKYNAMDMHGENGLVSYSRPLTLQEKADANFAAFTADPSNTELELGTLSRVSRNNPEAPVQALDSIPDGHKVTHPSTVLEMANNMRPSGLAARSYYELINDLRNGDSNVSAYAENGHLHLSKETADGPIAFDAYTGNKVRSDDMDTSRFKNSQQMGAGAMFYGTTERMSAAEKASAELRRIVDEAPSDPIPHAENEMDAGDSGDHIAADAASSPIITETVPVDHRTDSGDFAPKPLEGFAQMPNWSNASYNTFMSNPTHPDRSMAQGTIHTQREQTPDILPKTLDALPSDGIRRVTNRDAIMELAGSMSPSGSQAQVYNELMSSYLAGDPAVKAYADYGHFHMARVGQSGKEESSFDAYTSHVAQLRQLDLNKLGSEKMGDATMYYDANVPTSLQNTASTGVSDASDGTHTPSMVISKPEYSPGMIAELKKNPSLIHQTHSSLAKQNAVIQDASYITAASINDARIPPSNRDLTAAKSAMNMAVDNGTVIQDRLGAHSATMIFQDASGTWEISKFDQTVAEQKGFCTADDWTHAGYTRVTDSAGNFQYISAQHTSFNAEHVQEYMGGNDTALKQSDFATFTKQDINTYFSSMADHQRFFDYQPNESEALTPAQEAYLDNSAYMLDAMQRNGIAFGGKKYPRPTLNDARSALLGHEVLYSKSSPLGFVHEMRAPAEDGHAPQFIRVTALTAEGAANNKLDANSLHQKKFTPTTIAGTTYWANVETKSGAQIPNDATRARERMNV